MIYYDNAMLMNLKGDKDMDEIIVEHLPLISADSSLRKLPDGLKQSDRMLLDGIRYSVEMAEIGYKRLINSLYLISFSDEQSEVVDFAAIFADIWSIIDAVSRLRRLIYAIPNAKDHETAQSFYSKTDSIRLLRNRVQHMEERYVELVELQEPAWGYITWVSFYQFSTDGLPSAGRTHLLASGSIRGVELQFESPLKKSIAAPLGMISLRAFGFFIDIDETIADIKLVVQVLEESFAQHFSGMPTSLADFYMGFAFTMDANQWTIPKIP